MNVGNPTDDDKDLVKLNQQTPSTNNQPAISNPSPSAPVASPLPDNTVKDENNNIGVGKPNIGVELEPKKTESPSSLPPIQAKPQTQPTSPPPSPPSADKPGTIDVSTSQIDIPNTSPPAPTAPKPLPPTNLPETLPTEKAQTADDKIDVQTAHVPINKYDEPKPPTPPGPAMIEPQPSASNVPISPVIGGGQPATNMPTPPIKAYKSPVTTIAVLAIMALILGTGGGFFGYRYWDKLKTSASTETSPSPTTSESPSSDITKWQIYTSTLYKFSIKFPNGWQQSTSDANAEKIVLAADKASLEGTPSNYKVEINFQANSGKTLKTWVEANTAAIGEKTAAKEITINEQTAYQQQLSKNGPAVATYIERQDKVMIMTYSAPSDKFGSGGEWYNDMINSLKLM